MPDSPDGDSSEIGSADTGLSGVGSSERASSGFGLTSVGTSTADSSNVGVVWAWHAALNAGDVERLLSLSTDNVEVGGPRGVGRGADQLRDWVGRANIQLEPRESQVVNGAVVVEEVAQWRTPDGKLTEPQTVASAFRVVDGKVDSVIRYDGVPSALAAVEGRT